jgi:hypothetical protein
VSQYVTPDELKKTLTLTGTIFADYDIDPAIEAASDALNEMCGRRKFDADTTTPTTRYYKPSNPGVIVINDMIELVSLTTDTDGDGDFEDEYVLNTDIVLWPLNALADGRPYTQIRLNPAKATTAFPHCNPRGAKVEGKFGWPAVPSFLNPATKMLATKLIKRMREAPFGVVTVGLDVGSAIRIGRSDPDIMGLIEPYTREAVI